MATGRSQLELQQLSDQCREASHARNRRSHKLLIETDALLRSSEERLARSREALVRLAHLPAKPDKQTKPSRQKRRQPA
jgi:hypothetical protein